MASSSSGVAGHGVVSQFASGRKPFSSLSFSWAPEKMGRAYFSVYWTYITVQLVFIRPDLILIQRSEVSQRCTVNEIPATPDEEKQQPLLHS
jgi:hypothetical protein